MKFGLHRGIGNSAIVLSIALISLGGCSGGKKPLQVFADGEPIDASDYIGKKFPFLYVLGEEDDPTAIVEGGEAELFFVDVNTVRVKLPGRDEETYVRVDDTNEFVLLGGGAGDPSVFVDDYGAYQFAYMNVGENPGVDFAGFFGLETPVDLRPAAVAVYEGDVMGVIFGSEGEPEYALLADGGGSLTADFGAGTVSGVLVDASASYAQDEDGIENDEIFAQLDLTNGVINKTGFDGNVSGEMAFSIDGAEPVAVSTSFFNTDVDGKFFGNAAESAGAQFDGDVTLDLIELPDRTLHFEGFFVGSQNLEP